MIATHGHAIWTCAVVKPTLHRFMFHSISGEPTPAAHRTLADRCAQHSACMHYTACVLSAALLMHLTMTLKCHCRDKYLRSTFLATESDYAFIVVHGRADYTHTRAQADMLVGSICGSITHFSFTLRDMNRDFSSLNRDSAV